ncbi:ABC transporter permease [Roseomonas sp. AR75]|uniref:ABC transporter permease n=1 Tax=Roseomonas sp. AR75 TaxID=2562311 RepID=UPI0014857C6D|nr:ABC transporter permease [Roseomonas sp. AR75]
MAQAGAGTAVVAPGGAAIPPGASATEDGVREWEAAQRRHRNRIALSRLALAVVLIGLWEFGTGRWWDAFWFSSPSRIAAHLWEWSQDDLFFQLSVTLRETFVGYFAGTLAGVALGAVLARLDFLCRVLDPFILALNGIPRIALAPLFIIWFGIGELSKMVLASMLAFFLCFYATLSGLRSVDAAHVNVARIMGATERQIFTKVTLPAAFPWILTAMKVSVPFALIGAIVGEFMAATAGLGYKIQLYTAQFDTTGAVSGIFVLMLVVIAFNFVLDRIERHLLRWRPPRQQGAGGEMT